MIAQFIKSAFQPSHYPPPDRPEVAFAGRSNVGKSSLINTIANRRGLARTSSKPGRTQAINFFIVDNHLYLVDLPGYGFARVPIQVKKSWRHMVETYLKKRQNLKAVVVILDIRREPTPGDMDLFSWLHVHGIPAITVLTKTDKLSRQQAGNRAVLIGRRLEHTPFKHPVLFSAKTKQGRKEICEKIRELTGYAFYY